MSWKEEENGKKALRKWRRRKWVLTGKIKNSWTAQEISLHGLQFTELSVTAVGSVIQNTEVNLPYLEAKNGKKNCRIISIK